MARRERERDEIAAYTGQRVSAGGGGRRGGVGLTLKDAEAQIGEQTGPDGDLDLYVTCDERAAGHAGNERRCPPLLGRGRGRR